MPTKKASSPSPSSDGVVKQRGEEEEGGGGGKDFTDSCGVGEDDIDSAGPPLPQVADIYTHYPLCSQL